MQGVKDNEEGKTGERDDSQYRIVGLSYMVCQWNVYTQIVGVSIA